ncbi:unnamed protein product [Bursaphelenchus xylophilus]|uniref:(pine wood nematode) hypothetical protein n=1 Tax=Bursaphelenchus xylophilus TaxID=6326 RepID=A0A7I8X1V1_BURXY|nr:unnamed protein product [Bursaphelenchus xylophilus]CAG9130770.1 unnamed protein product [Bursaphelenchus xylophilus]
MTFPDQLSPVTCHATCFTATFYCNTINFSEALITKDLSPSSIAVRGLFLPLVLRWTFDVLTALFRIQAPRRPLKSILFFDDRDIIIRVHSDDAYREMG